MYPEEQLTVKNDDDKHPQPIYIVVHPRFKHLPPKIVLQLLAACQVSYDREVYGITSF